MHRIVCMEALCSFSYSRAHIHTYACTSVCKTRKVQLPNMCDGADETGENKEELGVGYSFCFVFVSIRRDQCSEELSVENADHSQVFPGLLNSCLHTDNFYENNEL